MIRTSHEHPLKRLKTVNHCHEQPLIPGLPDHLAQLCLSLVPPSLLFSVCHSWRRLIYSPSFPPFLSLYAILSPTTTDSNPSPTSTYNHSSIKFFTYDPISSRWSLLPPPPADPPLRLLLRHPSFISRHIPVQSVSASGNLVLLAATTDNFNPALSRPLVFNPISRTWTFGPRLATPRRWCAAGTTLGAVYVASGIGSHFSIEVAKSVEKWDLQTRNRDGTKIQGGNYNNSNMNKNNGFSWKWEKVKCLKDGRFCRDAVDAVGWREKLCMVNMKGDAAKEGIIYDTKKGVWEDMPEGMVAGWKGPAAAMNEEEVYVVDEAKGALRKYDPERDKWEEILKSERLKGAQQIAAGGRKVCAISCGGGSIMVVDTEAKPVSLRLIDTPPGLEAVAVHILPRMSLPDIEFQGTRSTSI